MLDTVTAPDIQPQKRMHFNISGIACGLRATALTIHKENVSTIETEIAQGNTSSL